MDGAAVRDLHRNLWICNCSSMGTLGSALNAPSLLQISSSMEASSRTPLLLLSLQDSASCTCFKLHSSPRCRPPLYCRHVCLSLSFPFLGVACWACLLVLHLLLCSCSYLQQQTQQTHNCFACLLAERQSIGWLFLLLHEDGLFCVVVFCVAEDALWLCM